MILHAVWTRRRLHLWAEGTSRELSADASAATAGGEHPFAIDASTLSQALSASSGAFESDAVELTLPCGPDGRPWASPVFFRSLARSRRIVPFPRSIVFACRASSRARRASCPGCLNSKPPSRPASASGMNSGSGSPWPAKWRSGSRTSASCPPCRGSPRIRRGAVAALDGRCGCPKPRRPPRGGDARGRAMRNRQPERSGRGDRAGHRGVDRRHRARRAAGRGLRRIDRLLGRLRRSARGLARRALARQASSRLRGRSRPRTASPGPLLALASRRSGRSARCGFGSCSSSRTNQGKRAARSIAPAASGPCDSA